MPASTVVDKVNEQDQPIGTIDRAELFKRPANFRVTHVFIFNSRGELLLQRLSPTRLRHPGRWGSSVAAYVGAGEDYTQAATRRLREELGLTDLPLRKVGKTRMVDDACVKFITLFEARSDGPFALDPTHIAEVEFCPVDRVQSMVVQDPSRFTPTFRYLLDFYLQERAS